MKQLLLVRHGQSVANSQGVVQGWLDSPLSDLGHRQAQCLGNRLAQNFNVTHIFTSPLQRAYHTATYLSHLNNLSIQKNPNLRERNLGPISGLHKDQIMARFPEVETAWRNHLPRPHLEGAEDDATFRARVQQALDDIQAATPNNAVAAVFSHGGTLVDMLQILLNLPPTPRHFRLENTALSIVNLYPTHAQIKILNDTCHLGDDCANRPSDHP